jgi:hypothetical protein
MEATVQPWLVREIKRDFLTPILDLLKRMHDERVSHRNLRPTNLFRKQDDGTVQSGQIYSAPPGFDQPTILEPIERARCIPTGRGIGDMADDMFAIGATILLLTLGRNPVAGIDEKELLQRRIELGSFNAILGGNKLPAEIAPVVRSLMRDDAHERWTHADLMNWVTSGRVNPSQPIPGIRADRPFEFNGIQAYTPTEVAQALLSDWGKAVVRAATNDIAHWAERSLKDRALASALAESSTLESNGPKQMTPDILLSRTLIVLDPTGPIGMRGMRVIPDGFGTAVVSAVRDPALAKAYSDIILGKVMGFWHEQQVRPKTWMLTASEVAEKASVYLAQTGTGFSIERCAYELNPSLSCLSPLVKGKVAIQSRDMIEIMEERAGDGELLFDRHILGFLGARVSGKIDRELTDIGQASDDSMQRVALLRALAYVQSKNSSTKARQLYAVFLEHLKPVLSDYKNVAMRHKLERAAKKVASRGSLNDLVRIIDNRKNQKWDERGFAQAKNRHARLDTEIYRIKTDAKSVRRQANRLGQQFAANIASVFGLLVLGALVVMQLS